MQEMGMREAEVTNQMLWFISWFILSFIRHALLSTLCRFPSTLATPVKSDKYFLLSGAQLQAVALKRVRGGMVSRDPEGRA